MNISPLKSPQKLKIEDFGRFKKVRELSGSNIFPTLFISCIEQLIIKKCSNFAFEVFFGLMFEIGEKLEITSLDTTKEGLAEFTCAMQTHRLKDFRALQEKSGFFSMINEIGGYYDLGHDLKTLKSVQFSLANVKVSVLIRSEFYSRESYRSETNYATLKVLQGKDKLWLMLENEDFMDDEALERRDKRKQAKAELLYKKEREKIEKQQKEAEDRRVSVENLMRRDEKCRFEYLRAQKDSEKRVRDAMSSGDLQQRGIKKEHVVSQVRFVQKVVGNDEEMKRFFKEERALEGKLAERMRSLEVEVRRAELKSGKRMKKVGSCLEKSEKEVRWAGLREKEMGKCVRKVLESEEGRYWAGKEIEKGRRSLGRDRVGVEDRRGQRIWKDMKGHEAEMVERMMSEESLNRSFNKQEENLNLKSKHKMDREDIHIKGHTDNENTKGRFFWKKLLEEDQFRTNYLKEEQKIHGSAKCSLNTTENLLKIFGVQEENLRKKNVKSLVFESNLTENFVNSETQVKNSSELKLVKESEKIKNFSGGEVSLNSKVSEKLAQSELWVKEHMGKEYKCSDKVGRQMDYEESLNTQNKKLEKNQALLNTLALSSKDLIHKTNNKLQISLELSTISKMLHQDKQMKKFLKNEKKLAKTQKLFLASADTHQKTLNLKTQKAQKKIFASLKISKSHSKLLKKWEKDLKKSTTTHLLSEEKLTKLNTTKESFIKKTIQKTLEKEEKSIRLLQRNQNLLSDNSLESLAHQERLSKKFQAHLQVLEKEQEVKKDADKKYQEALRKIEFQKIAEKQRQARQRQLRLEKDNLRRQSELRKKEQQTDLPQEPNTPSIPPPDLESQVSDDVLFQESKIIESLSLICGSYFCTQCYRMLKRSSLFLKCSLCCNTAFKQKPSKHSDPTRAKIPENALCVGCSSTITKGELVSCICCYIKQDFIKDHSPPCQSCSDPDSVSWVDTYLGSKYELVNCGFCQRQVNYQYILEICPTCHDQICLHCLRKNHFLSNSVCNECHSRRRVNPYRLV